MKIDIKVGEFIKWTSKDEDGAFIEIGQVTEVTEADVTFKCKVGTNTVKWDDANSKFAKTKAIDLSRPKAEDDETWHLSTNPAVKTEKVAREPHAPKQGSKLEQAHLLFKDATDKDRKAIIALFQEKLTMTPAGAQTYYYLVKKGVTA